MNKASIHIGKRFDLVLQILGDVMCSPKRHFGREDNVDFDKVVGAGMVDSTSVHLLNLGGEGHGLIESQADCFVQRRVAPPTL